MNFISKKYFLFPKSFTEVFNLKSSIYRIYTIVEINYQFEFDVWTILEPSEWSNKAEFHWDLRNLIQLLSNILFLQESKNKRSLKFDWNWIKPLFSLLFFLIRFRKKQKIEELFSIRMEKRKSFFWSMSRCFGSVGRWWKKVSELLYNSDVSSIIISIAKMRELSIFCLGLTTTHNWKSSALSTFRPKFYCSWN